jgi:hypothetical protein
LPLFSAADLFASSAFFSAALLAAASEMLLPVSFSLLAVFL